MTSLVVEEKILHILNVILKTLKKRYRVPPWVLVISNLYPCGFYILQVLYSKHKNLQLKINI